MILKSAVRVGLALLVAGTAQLQAQTIDRTSMMAACRIDFFRHCPTVTPGGGRIIACLSNVIDQISPACAALVNAGANCVPDIQKFCADVELRGDETLNCLIAHRERLSGGCAATLATAASQ